jgi:hypothetical protein
MKFIKNHRILTLLIILIIAPLSWLTACQSNHGNFTEFPGFTEYFAQHPPADTLPTTAEQALLSQYRPHLFAAKNQQQPINFYQDYISNGRLHIDGELLSSSVDQALLNQYRDNKTAEFVYTGALPLAIKQPVGYGRVNYDSLNYQGKTYDFTFLSYNFVFPTSGIIKGLSLLPNLAISIVGDKLDWHQLDHYVGLTVALYNGKPIAVSMQQHNGKTTYMVDKDMDWPSDDRVAADIAMQSNELYPHSAQETKHPGVSFITSKEIEFVKTGENKPLMAGWDITKGEQEVDYQLQYLAPSDAFYQFKGWLGQRRKLPGRDGPPGADYVTLPDLMPHAISMVGNYRPGTVAEEKAKIAKLFNPKEFSINKSALTAYINDFMRDAQLD